jgi:hypothetical protein
MANKNIVRADGTYRGGNGGHALKAPLIEKNATGRPARLLTEAEVAELLNWSKKNLQRRRALGLEPAFIKLGSGPRASVRYSARVILAFIENGQRTSTSQAPQAAA